MRGLVACVVLVASVAVAGCGSSGNKTDGGGGGGAGGAAGTGGGAVTANCGPFTACGGSIVGTWRYVSACGSFSSATCPTETTLTTPAPGSTATYTFGSGGVFTYTFSGTLNETVNYALGCLAGLTDAGVPQACADVQNLFRMSIGQDAGSSTTQLLSATCSAGQNETCNCMLAFSAQSVTTQGTYTTSGARVTITDPDGGADASTPVDYCVSGNTLTLRLANDAGSGLITLSH
jgi:YD repeat-containing protein